MVVDRKRFVGICCFISIGKQFDTDISHSVRICLRLRLDWDKSNSRQNSDIYIKPRLIMLASTVVFGIFYSYMIVRVRKFSPRLNGIGDYRRNILTFNELTKVLVAILLFFLFESLLVFALYNVQDHIGTDGVFIAYFAFCFLFETVLGIFLVWVVAYKSLANFSDLWCDSEPKNLSFFITPHLIEPRREELYIVSDGAFSSRLKDPGIETEHFSSPGDATNCCQVP